MFGVKVAYKTKKTKMSGHSESQNIFIFEKSGLNEINLWVCIKDS